MYTIFVQMPHTGWAQACKSGRVNRWDFRDVLKPEKVDCWRTERGSLFQVSGPETEKARGPKVLSLVHGVQRIRGSKRVFYC